MPDTITVCTDCKGRGWFSVVLAEGTRVEVGMMTCVKCVSEQCPYVHTSGNRCVLSEGHQEDHDLGFYP